jgi:cytochrome c-type biogenesis protein CcmE
MSPRQRRLVILLVILAGATASTTLALLGLQQNISFFRTPSEIISGRYPEQGTDRRIRIGGLVERGSLERRRNAIQFIVTDQNNNLTVRYEGIVPDLFREGQGVIAEGRMVSADVLVADKLLAKHDENYIPPELKKLKQGG